jgi:hypothetical protein
MGKSVGSGRNHAPGAQYQALHSDFMAAWKAERQAAFGPVAGGLSSRQKCLLIVQRSTSRQSDKRNFS